MTVTVQHIWCGHCAQPYTVPLNFGGCPVCGCADPDSCVSVESTEPKTKSEWRRRILAGCMSDPVEAP
jgi:hypothetical protein